MAGSKYVEAVETDHLGFCEARRRPRDSEECVGSAVLLNVCGDPNRPFRSSPSPLLPTSRTLKQSPAVQN